MNLNDAGGLGLVQQTLLGEAVESMHGVAVFVWDEDRHYVAVNEAACELVGRSREEILQMEVGALTPDGAAPEMERARHEPIVTGASVVNRADGGVEIEWVTCRAVVANLPYMVSVVWRKGAGLGKAAASS
jgi:PAS domain S-box-containing protein